MANEKRLIDANILKTLFDVRYDTAFIQERTRENKEQWNGYCAGINWGRNTIADAPTVDAVPVVHGRWVGSGQWNHKPCRMKNKEKWQTYLCSECGHSNGRRFNDKYCPNCGAKMDGL